MAEREIDILARKARADAILESTARQLGEILHEGVRELDPFPHFLDSPFVKAIEAEPGAAQRADLGCVVVCPDGELYEYTYTISVAGPFPDFSRQEETKKLDLPPRDYISYAYNAICEITRLLMERNP